MTEQWKDIFGFDGRFQVSNFGRVRSIGRIMSDGKGGVRLQPGRILRTFFIGPYCGIVLSLNATRSTFYVHRLVAQAFIPNPENKPTVNHKDWDAEHNWVGNLEWATYKENAIHEQQRPRILVTNRRYIA